MTKLHLTSNNYLMAAESSPLAGSMARKMRKSGCGAMVLTPSSSPQPPSVTARTPPSSKRPFRRSRTEAEH